jgi:hypothetical protein
MQYSPGELEGGHMVLHELMKLFFCLMVLCELGLTLSPSTKISDVLKPRADSMALLKVGGYFRNS